MRSYRIVVVFLMLWVGCDTVGLKNAWADDTPRYATVMSKNKSLCTHIREVLNDDLINYGPGYDERKFRAPIFSTIAWTPTKEFGEKFDYAGAVAHVDINNDGTTDVVIRQVTSGGRDVTLHWLFIFKSDQFPELAEKRRELEDNSTGFLVFENSYELRSLPQKMFKDSGLLKGKKYYEGLSSAAYIHPFRFQGKTYLLLTQSPDSPAVPNWALIANYKQGKVRGADPTMMDDQCYLSLK